MWPFKRKREPDEPQAQAESVTDPSTVCDQPPAAPGRTLRSILRDPGTNRREWLFLPRSEEWHIDIPTLVAVMVEVPPEDQDKEDAGYPEEARAGDLMAALPMTEVEDIIANARKQKPTASDAELHEAFLYHYDNDAYATMR